MPVTPPGGCGSFAPCQSQSGFGDPGAWSNQSAYTQTGEVDNVSCQANVQGWQPTGVQVLAGESLSVIAGGEASFSASGFCYPEGSYPGGARHMGVPGIGPAPGGDFDGHPILSLTGNAQALALKFTPTDVAPAWVGHDATLAFPGRSGIVLANQINAGAGGFVWVCQNDNVYGDNACCFNVSFRRLMANATGTPAAFTYAAATDTQNCRSLIILTIVDNSGNPVALPTGETQTFTLVDLTGAGSFSPSANVTIEPGQSQAIVAYSNPNTGTYTVQVLVGPGVLQTVTPVPAGVTLSCVVPCAASDPIAAQCAITRPLIRDAMMQVLGQIPDSGASSFGVPGAQSVSFPYPTLQTMNLAIGEALATINRRCNVSATMPLVVPIPPVPSGWLGPQFVPLTGMIGCPTQTSVNTVRRAAFQASGQSIIRLLPTNYWQMDQRQYPFDNDPPSVPVYYWVDVGSIALLPAVAASGGKLILYVGSAFPQFQTDQDSLDSLPADFQMVIANIAALLICSWRPGEPWAKDRMAFLQPLCEQGLRDINRWHSLQGEETQVRLVTPTGKRLRVR